MLAVRRGGKAPLPVMAYTERHPGLTAPELLAKGSTHARPRARLRLRGWELQQGGRRYWIAYSSSLDFTGMSARTRWVFFFWRRLTYYL